MTEPALVDLRWALTEIDLSLKNPRFADAMATLAAPLHGCDKDVLIGEDVRQHNRTRRVVALTTATVLTLLVVAAVSAVVARQQLLRATAGLANTLALSAVTSNAGRETPLLAAVGASRLADTSETRAALIQLVQRNQHVARFFSIRPTARRALSRSLSAGVVRSRRRLPRGPRNSGTPRALVAPSTQRSWCPPVRFR